MKTVFIKWHNALIWFGLFAVVVWSLSGITHPLMAWFGPQAEKRFPPALTVESQDVTAVKRIIKQHNLSSAAIAKVVPTADGAMLQITEQNAETINRRYFSLNDQQEQVDYDTRQAKWLAAYYTGNDVDDVNSVSLVTEFDSHYPWVNRLLPVYRVGFSNSDLYTYVYTETNVLASISNDTKQLVQGFFQALHTWNFLDFTGFGRVFIIGLLMLMLAGMAITGLLLVITIARRPIKNTSRRWHRVLAYTLWLPMFAWPASGFYHLLQAQYVDSVAGLRLSKPVDLQQWLTSTTDDATWQKAFTSAINSATPLNAISLVTSNDQYFYRLSLANKGNNPVSRNSRFDGESIEKGVIYIDSDNGQMSEHTDAEQAISLLQQHKGAAIQYNHIEQVTRFGPGYDFRNKRLPVWQINLDDEAQTHVFVDPITNVLVDQNRQIDRLESLSFSLLHKWNHLFPLIGREWRDILVVITLLFCLGLAAFGLQIHLSRKRQR